MIEAKATMLFDPARHAPLVDVAWDAGRARSAIDAIVRDTIRTANADSLWPVHPEDKDGDTPAFYDLYLGASGVVWALDALRRAGATDAEFRPDLDVSAWLAANRATFPSVDRLEGLLGGDAGLLIAQWRRKPSESTAAALARAVETNLDNPAMELMWGAPGSMLAALAMHETDGAPVWRDLYRRGAERTIAAFAQGPDGISRWTQALWGRTQRMLGLVHGFAGNAHALIRGRSLLDPERWAAVSADLARTLRAMAIWDGAAANWPSHAAEDEPGRKMLMQICHGAPGMIVGLAQLDQPIDDLLIAGGEAVWRAGPLAKGSNLCHGTAGNGYAFLKLFARTGDEMWLVRARAFAMHAMAQSEAEIAHYGMRRFSLWTGDLGLAMHLHSCLAGDAMFPTLDTL
jgi:hypothetical protein